MRAPHRAFTALALAATWSVAVPAASSRQTEAELKSVREKIEKVTQEVNHDVLERDRQSSALRSAELSLGQARAELARLEHEYSDRSARRTALTQEAQRQRRALADERAALAGQLRAAYMIGQEEPLKLLLNQQDPLHSGRMLTYYAYFGHARADQIAQIETHLKQLDALDTELAQQQSQLADLKVAQSAQLSQLQQSRNERQRVLASLTAQAHSREQSLARLQAQQADLERLLKELTRSLRAVPAPDNASAFGRLRGQLGWPVSGHVTAAFGDRRASDVKWEGIVIATERGAAVTAVSAGRVVYADWLPGLGLLMIIDHGEGYMSLYGHNDRLLKSVGDLVDAGEPIATAGDTGGRAEPELYFEIRRGGKPVDPGPWFRQRSPSP